MSFLNQISIVGREIEGLRGEWKGPAALQFDGLMGQWNHDAQNITQVLDQVVQKNSAIRQVLAMKRLRALSQNFSPNSNQRCYV